MRKTKKKFDLTSELLELRHHIDSGLLRRIQSIDSEVTPAYSDLLHWGVNPRVVWNSVDWYILTVGIILVQDKFNDDQYRYLVNSILKEAHARNYQGRWDLIREYLIKDFSPGEMMHRLYEDKGPSSYYGVYKKRLKKAIPAMLRCQLPGLPCKLPVRKPQRKRGYDDKGYLSLERYGIGNTAKVAVQDKEGPWLYDILSDFYPYTPTWLENIDETVNHDHATLVVKRTSDLAKKSSDKVSVQKFAELEDKWSASSADSTITFRELYEFFLLWHTANPDETKSFETWFRNSKYRHHRTEF